MDSLQWAAVAECLGLVSPQARENEQEDAGTLDSAVGSSSLAESTSLNMEVLTDGTSNTIVILETREDVAVYACNIIMLSLWTIHCIALHGCFFSFVYHFKPQQYYVHLKAFEYFHLKALTNGGVINPPSIHPP